MNWTLVILSLLVMLDKTFCAKRVHRAKRNPNKSTELTNVQGRRGLAEMVAALLPNTYYSRPRFRYPYYGKDGKENSVLICFIVFFNDKKAVVNISGFD